MHRDTNRHSRVRVGVALLGLLLASGPAVVASNVKVDSAEPSAAEQGTIDLDVTINGRGFDQGSVADFLVTGTENPGGVVVKSTTFVSAKKLVVRIDVDEQAVISLYDIQVTTSRGRRGKGTETFAVTQQGGGSNQILIEGTFRDHVDDRFLSDNSSPYVDEMPGTGNLVFQPQSRVFRLLLQNDPEVVELGGECEDDLSKTEVCLRDGSTRVNPVYDTGFLSINKLESGGLDCAGNPFDLAPRDMIVGECIQVYASSSMDHPGAKPRVKLRLRCGKHPWEGDDQMRLECLASDSEGCQGWDLRPFDDGSGNEHLTCQLYHLARKGNEENVELAEYDIVFAMTIDRVAGN